jgi:hypothetical protein
MFILHKIPNVEAVNDEEFRSLVKLVQEQQNRIEQLETSIQSKHCIIYQMGLEMLICKFYV